MGDEPGFDEQFDGRIFRMNFHNTVRPRAWPLSVSEMRRHTAYESQGMLPPNYDYAVVFTPDGPSPVGRAFRFRDYPQKR